MVCDWEKLLASESEAAAGTAARVAALMGDSDSDDEGGHGIKQGGQARVVLTDITATVSTAVAANALAAVAEGSKPASKAGAKLSPQSARGQSALKAERARKRERDAKLSELANAKRMKETEVKTAREGRVAAGLFSYGVKASGSRAHQHIAHALVR